MGEQQNSKSLNALTNIFCGLALCAGTLTIASSSAQAQSSWPQKGAVKNGTIAQQGRSQAVQPYRRNTGNRSTGGGNAQRINKIIQGLTPHGASHGKSKRYRKKIRKIITYRKGHGHVGRPIIVNYNRSVDLSVYFEFNSTRILPAARPVLDDLGYALNSPKLRFARYLIAGHTDARGARGYNQWLSDERARAVAQYLSYNFNIAPHRLVSVGFGEENLVNRRRPSAAINRRVEVSLIENNLSYVPQQTIQIRKYKFTPIR